MRCTESRKLSGREIWVTQLLISDHQFTLLRSKWTIMTDNRCNNIMCKLVFCLYTHVARDKIMVTWCFYMYSSTEKQVIAPLKTVNSEKASLSRSASYSLGCTYYKARVMLAKVVEYQYWSGQNIPLHISVVLSGWGNSSPNEQTNLDSTLSRA